MYIACMCVHQCDIAYISGIMFVIRRLPPCFGEVEGRRGGEREGGEEGGEGRGGEGGGTRDLHCKLFLHDPSIGQLSASLIFFSKGWYGSIVLGLG